MDEYTLDTLLCLMANRNGEINPNVSVTVEHTIIDDMIDYVALRRDYAEENFYR